MGGSSKYGRFSNLAGTPDFIPTQIPT